MKSEQELLVGKLGEVDDITEYTSYYICQGLVSQVSITAAREGLISFLQSMQISHPYHPNSIQAVLRPYQEEMAKEYLTHRELFLGVARQIGTTTVLSGIAAWELLSRPGCVVAVDNDRLFEQTAIRLGPVSIINQTKTRLKLFNGSVLITLPRYPFKGYEIDVMLLEPASSMRQSYDDWFMCAHSLLKSDTGKLLIACTPCSSVKNLYQSWKAANKPMAMFDYMKCGMIDRLGLDWYETNELTFSPMQFAAEFCCDFSVYS